MTTGTGDRTAAVGEALRGLSSAPTPHMSGAPTCSVALRTGP